MSLPVFLECLGLALFAVTAIRTQKRDVPLWRSSFLPLLYCSLDERAPRGRHSTRDLCVTEHSAKKTIVAFDLAFDDKKISWMDLSARERQLYLSRTE